jgi:hypothetical protein
MVALRLKQVLAPLLPQRRWSPWALAPTYSQELRQLKRRVAAARLGECAPRSYTHRWRYDDLR